MPRKQLTIFFVTNFILFFTGNGLYPLLPLFAGEFGASVTVAGLFLASLSATNAAGALLAGRLLARFAPRTLYTVVSVLGVLGLLALALARSLWLVVAATALVWFVGGFVMAISNILTGLTVAAESRGRAFGLLFLASPVAAIFGGGALGIIVNGSGYAPGFLVLAVMWAVIPALGLHLQRARLPQTTPSLSKDSTVAPAAALGRSFYLLLVSALAVAAAIQTRNVAAFLQMQAAGFSPAAISSTTVTAGVAAIPVALFAGSLSDRIGRRTLLMGTTALVLLMLIPLSAATELWHFAAGIALLLVATVALRPVTTAVVTDLLAPAALRRGLPLLEAGIMGVGTVATAAAGYILERFGPSGITLLSVALLLLSAAALALLCTQRLVGNACPAPVQRLALRG